MNYLKMSLSMAVISLAFSIPAHAETTVTVDGSDKVTVVESGGNVQPAERTVIREEDPREFEGVITHVDAPKGRIVVHDTLGRERKVDLKKGMAGTYKVDDYVRIRLMADMKEAKTVETINATQLEGHIVSVDNSRGEIVIRDDDGADNAVILAQGQITNYRVGDNVQIYVLPDRRDQVQVIRVISR